MLSAGGAGQHDPTLVLAALEDATKLIDVSKTKLRIVFGGFAQNVAHWNHAKIIAVDGHLLVTGGHNLWEPDYLRAAPITDSTIELSGSVTKGSEWGSAAPLGSGGNLMFPEVV